MDAVILNAAFESIDVIDSYSSFIWTDRYNGAGDFELYMPAFSQAFESLKVGNYVYNRNSDRVMVIEEISIESQTEEGDFLTIKGRSLESYLDRRVIWNFTTLSGNLQNGIKKLLDENVISPSNAQRRIPGFVFRASTDPKITSLTIDEIQFHGENLYDAITMLCEIHSIGWRLLPTFDGAFLFELYAGKDHSYAQDVNPWVVFSADYDNLLTSNYYETDKEFKTVALALGEGEGSDKKTVEVPSSGGALSGLARRETAFDVTVSVDSDIDENKRDEEYIKLLKNQCEEYLSECKPSVAFDGEVESRIQFAYGVDYFVGDIVQVVNAYGLEASSRVSEIVFSCDETGETMIPTFVKIEEE